MLNHKRKRAPLSECTNDELSSELYSHAREVLTFFNGILDPEDPDDATAEQDSLDEELAEKHGAVKELPLVHEYILSVLPSATNEMICVCACAHEALSRCTTSYSLKALIDTRKRVERARVFTKSLQGDDLAKVLDKFVADTDSLIEALEDGMDDAGLIFDELGAPARTLVVEDETSLQSESRSNESESELDDFIEHDESESSSGDSLEVVQGT